MGFSGKSVEQISGGKFGFQMLKLVRRQRTALEKIILTIFLWSQKIGVSSFLVLQACRTFAFEQFWANGPSQKMNCQSINTIGYSLKLSFFKIIFLLGHASESEIQIVASSQWLDVPRVASRHSSWCFSTEERILKSAHRFTLSVLPMNCIGYR